MFIQSKHKYVSPWLLLPSNKLSIKCFDLETPRENYATKLSTIINGFCGMQNPK
jgi:hypothetical protein